MDDFKRLTMRRHDDWMDCPDHFLNGNPKQLKRIRRRQARHLLRQKDRKWLSDPDE